MNKHQVSNNAQRPKHHIPDALEIGGYLDFDIRDFEFYAKEGTVCR
jgi:hypothetical protein